MVDKMAVDSSGRIATSSPVINFLVTLASSRCVEPTFDVTHLSNGPLNTFLQTFGLNN